MSRRCEHGKDSDICVQCWEETHLEPKDIMLVPSPKCSPFSLAQLEETIQKQQEEIDQLKLSNSRMREALTVASVGSCTCLTKSPEAKYHLSSCVYRVIQDALSTEEPPPIHCKQPLPSDEELSKASVEAGKRMGRILALHATHDLSLQQAALEAQSTLDDLCNVHAKRSRNLALVAEKLYEALETCEMIEYEPEKGLFQIVQSYLDEKAQEALTLANQHGIGLKKG